MARTVDPQRHHARRLQIIDAALSVFAQRGYDGATTAAICKRAGIGSGTFFHYFPAKIDVLLAILALGVDQTRDFEAGLDGLSDARKALALIVDRVVAEAADRRVPGFVQAVAGVMNNQRIAEALAEDERAQRRVIRKWVERGARDGLFRTDVRVDRLTSWVLLLINGFLERVAVEEDFDAEYEGELLARTVEEFLRG